MAGKCVCTLVVRGWLRQFIWSRNITEETCAALCGLHALMPLP